MKSFIVIEDNDIISNRKEFYEFQGPFLAETAFKNHTITCSKYHRIILEDSEKPVKELVTSIREKIESFENNSRV